MSSPVLRNIPICRVVRSWLTATDRSDDFVGPLQAVLLSCQRLHLLDN